MANTPRKNLVDLEIELADQLREKIKRMPRK